MKNNTSDNQMPALMRAIDIENGIGPIESLFINAAVPKPVPGRDECLVRVHAFGLNRADTLQRQGKYPGISHLTKTLGLEFSGMVEEVGRDEVRGASGAQVGGRDRDGDAGDVDGGVVGGAHQGSDAIESRRDWAVGDPVFGLVYGGAYAEYVVVHKDMLIAKPDSLGFEICGGLCETWFTAFQALHLIGRFDPRATRSILWHAGASAVSIAGIQLSRLAHTLNPPLHHPTSLIGVAPHYGDNPEPSNQHSTPRVDQYEAPKVFATARQQEKCTFCVETLGCTGAVNLSSHPDKMSWTNEIKAMNGGHGIDLVIDFLGGPYLQANLDVLALDGAIVQLGLLDGAAMSAPNTNVANVLMKRARFEGTTLRTRSLEYQITLTRLFERYVLPGIVSGELVHMVERVLPWDQVALGHELLESNKTKGKIVCVVTQNTTT